MRIALFCPNWVGDLVMATPAFRAIRSHFPEAEIAGVMRPYLAGVLEGTDLVDRVLPFDAPEKMSREAASYTLSEFRRERFDLAVLFPNSFRSAWWAWLSGARRRVGFARNGRGFLLTETLSSRQRKIPHPTLDDYLLLAQAVGCQDISRDIQLATLPYEEEQLEDFWDRHPGLPHKGVVTLNVGGAFGSAKHWPVTSASLLARRMATELDKTVLVLCGPAEREQASQIAQLANHPQVVSLAEESLSLGLIKAAVKHSELLVSTDSGPRHFAAGFQTPVVVLFGPTHQAWSETYYSRSLHLQLSLDCGPCQQRTCPLGHHRCMRDLSADMVFEAVLQQLEQTPARTLVRAA
ncbi:MAG: lipopolysaccharide heptosyltransferase II [Planctomycetales bacterium]